MVPERRFTFPESVYKEYFRCSRSTLSLPSTFVLLSFLGVFVKCNCFSIKYWKRPSIRRLFCSLYEDVFLSFFYIFNLYLEILQSNGSSVWGFPCLSFYPPIRLVSQRPSSNSFLRVLRSVYFPLSCVFSCIVFRLQVKFSDG